MANPSRDDCNLGLELREVARTDIESIRSHLLRLDAKDRFMGFCNVLDDGRIHRFVDSISWTHSFFIGCFSDIELRGVVQVSVSDECQDEAEFAISIDRDFRGSGMASALMNAAVASAKIRGIRSLVMTSLNDNDAVKRLVRNLGFELTPIQKQVMGELKI
jgi:ribosomal protein S18 acetylase RimI-like enzyme